MGDGSIDSSSPVSVLFSVDEVGSWHQVQHAAHGSGSQLVYSLLDHLSAQPSTSPVKKTDSEAEAGTTPVEWMSKRCWKELQSRIAGSASGSFDHIECAAFIKSRPQCDVKESGTQGGVDRRDDNLVRKSCGSHWLKEHVLVLE